MFRPAAQLSRSAGPSRPARLSPGASLLCGAFALVAALGFGGCTGGGGFADADAVEKAGSLAGEPLPAHTWTADLAGARRTAAAEGKDVLMLFTGSDWCHFCKLLESQVFAKAPASRLTDQFVPVVMDYTPGGASKSAEHGPTHAAAAVEYGIKGFPTVILTSAAGDQYAEMSYDRRYEDGGAAAFLADAQALRAAKSPAAPAAEPSVGGRTAGL